MPSGSDIAISFTLADGSPVVVVPPTFDEPVSGIRERLGDALGIHPGRVVILFGGSPAEDWHTLTEALACGGLAQDGPHVATVIKKPCAANVADYGECWNVAASGGQGHGETRGLLKVSEIRQGKFAYSGEVMFPEPSNININMMPFLLGSKASLPSHLHKYWPLLEECHIPESSFDRVGYLTIQESCVEQGETQRRPGLHVESPGLHLVPSKMNKQRVEWGCGLVRMDKSIVEGGMYMASSVDSSCMAWDRQVSNANFIGELGSIEHLRGELPHEGGTPLKANTMYWLTDMTPHEALPMESAGHRQFLRVVAGPLSYWYEEHSTANPLVQIGAQTQIVTGDKFANVQPQVARCVAKQADGFAGVAFRPGRKDMNAALDIPNGTAVCVLRDFGEWVAIEWSGGDNVGYVKRRNLDIPHTERPSLVAMSSMIVHDTGSMSLSRPQSANFTPFRIGFRSEETISQTGMPSVFLEGIPNGTEISVLKAMGSDCIVESHGTLGFVRTDALDPGKYVARQVEGHQGVAFRLGTMEAAPSADIPNGTNIHCFYELGEFFAVEYKGMLGFVKKRNVVVERPGCKFLPIRSFAFGEHATLGTRDSSVKFALPSSYGALSEDLCFLSFQIPGKETEYEGVHPVLFQGQLGFARQGRINS